MRIAAYQFAVTGDMVENFEKIKNFKKVLAEMKQKSETQDI